MFVGFRLANQGKTFSNFDLEEFMNTTMKNQEILKEIEEIQEEKKWRSKK